MNCALRGAQQAKCFRRNYLSKATKPGVYRVKWEKLRLREVMDLPGFAQLKWETI